VGTCHPESCAHPWQLDENPDRVVPQVFLVESEQKDWVEEPVALGA